MTILFHNTTFDKIDVWKKTLKKYFKNEKIISIKDYKNFHDVNCYHMTGDVTTENNGGFIQIRNQLKPSISTEEFEGVYFKVFGNNEEYSIHVRTALTMAPWQYYKYSFKTNSEWTVIKAPFSEFKKSNAYQPKKLVGQNIKTLGLVAGFKDFQADICLSEIGFY